MHRNTSQLTLLPIISTIRSSSMPRRTPLVSSSGCGRHIKHFRYRIWLLGICLSRGLMWRGVGALLLTVLVVERKHFHVSTTDVLLQHLPGHVKKLLWCLFLTCVIVSVPSLPGQTLMLHLCLHLAPVNVNHDWEVQQRGNQKYKDISL